MVARTAGGRADLVSQLRRGVLEYCVLALLGREERYGFELIQELRELDGLVVGEGTIYPLLARLRREGLVDTAWKESDAGPPRRYYRLNTSGKKALLGFLKEWRRLVAAVDTLLEEEGHDG